MSCKAMGPGPLRRDVIQGCVIKTWSLHSWVRSRIIKQTCIYISLVIQYLGIKEKESKSCHGNVTHWRASALQYALFNWIHWEISLKMLFSVYISCQALKRPQQITSHYVIYKGSCKLNNKCVVKENVALKLLKVGHRFSDFYKVRFFTGMVENYFSWCITGRAGGCDS